MQIKTTMMTLVLVFILPLAFSDAEADTMATITTTKITLNIQNAIPGQSLFGGTATACFKSTGPNSPNCCATTGWGTDPSLSSCPDTAKALATAKNAGLAVNVGDSCIKNPDGSCSAPVSVYCVYPDKMTDIIETAGRVGQLGLGYGTPENPDCSGLTEAQIQKLDLTQMNLISMSSSS